jgi:hypothetical protein
MTMGLELRRFFTEGALDAFTELELRPGQGSLEIGEAFPPEIFEFWNKGLQLFNALSEVVDRKRFRSRPLGFCACHRMWQKCSPRRSG